MESNKENNREELPEVAEDCGENAKASEIDEEEAKQTDEDEKEQPEKTKSSIEHLKNRHNKRKIKRRARKVAVVAVVLLSLAFVCADVARDIFKLSNKDVVTVKLSGKENIDDIADLLKEEDVIRYKNVFKIIAKLKNLDSGFYEGSYVIEPEIKYTQVLRMFLNGKKEKMVTFAEGLTKKQVFRKLSETGFVKEEELEEAEKNGFDFEFLEGMDRKDKLEGYLFPETYCFASYQTPEEMICVMLNQFEKEFNEEYKKRAKELEMSIDQVVILASVIQAETAGEENMKNVSSVFYKRLENGEKLQSCATIQYLLEEKKFVLSEEDLKIDSPYNTYIYYGLPEGPICSPSRMAIEAALYPAETDYYYFQSDRDGNMYFSESFDEHEQVRKEIQGEE